MICIEKLAEETSGSDTIERSEKQGLCAWFSDGKVLLEMEGELPQILFWDFDRTEPKP